MTNLTTTLTLSVDDEGFLRRECPHCARDFKCRHGDNGEPMPGGGYHCPYCDGGSEDGWWTRQQLAQMEARVGSLGEDLVYDELKKLERRSSKSLTFRVSRSPRLPVPPVTDEPNDMRRVNFSCHPSEPAKVIESWSDPVHCLLCGKTT